MKQQTQEVKKSLAIKPDNATRLIAIFAETIKKRQGIIRNDLSEVHFPDIFGRDFHNKEYLCAKSCVKIG